MTAEDPWASLGHRYTIHEESKEFNRLLNATGGMKPNLEIGVEKAREAILSVALSFIREVEFDGEETEIIVPSPLTSEGIPVSVYKPASCPEVPAIWIYFHGGALVMGNRKTYETTAKILARDSGAIVLNVEYRLLPNPEALYAPFDDAEVVTKWVLENREKVGGKPNSKVGVGGDSSGGQIAIGVTNEVPGLDFQILIYPMSDTSMSHDSVREFKQIAGLTEDAIKFFFADGLYKIPDYLTNPRVNGMARTNTASSPPALIILAELDSSVGCGIDYAEKLRAAGVKVQLEVFKGITHVFFTNSKIFKTTTAVAYSHVAKFLNQFQ